MAFRYLMHICVIIASFEILHAFYFVLQSILWITVEVDVYDVLSLSSAIVWLIISAALLLGILRDYYHLLKLWLIFATIGFILDVLFLLYVFSAGILDWNKHRGPFLLFVAIALEGSCIFIIHLYYINIINETSRDALRLLSEYDYEYKQQQVLAQNKDAQLQFNLAANNTKDQLHLLKVNESKAPRIVNKNGNKEKKAKKEKKGKQKGMQDTAKP